MLLSGTEKDASAVTYLSTGTTTRESASHVPKDNITIQFRRDAFLAVKDGLST